MNKKNNLELENSFAGLIWKDEGPGAWHFITLPKVLSKRIRKIHQTSEEGWGRLKAKITIGESCWNTSIWFDTKCDSYLLPVKSVVRKKEKITTGHKVKVKIEFDINKLLLNKM
jgi:hypothetical protein